MKAKQSLTSRIRGWFPQEPLIKNFAVNNSSAPKTKAELDKKLFKHGSIANAIVFSTSLGIDALFIQPHYNYHASIEATILFFSVFGSALAVSNLLLYLRYRKQLQTLGCR